MRWLTVLALPAILCCSVSASAPVNPVNDFFGGVSAFTIGGHASDPVRRTPVGWQISASQKTKSAEEAATRGDSPLSLVGDFGGQFSTLDKGRALHAYEYMGGVRVRAGAIKKPTSVFGHALFGGATR